jgi:hypothetical protein
MTDLDPTQTDLHPTDRHAPDQPPYVLVVDEAQTLLAAGAGGRDITDALTALLAAGRRPGLLPVPGAGGVEVGPGEQVARTAQALRDLPADSAARGRALLTRSLQPHAGISALSGKTAIMRRVAVEAALAGAGVRVGGAR